jgi:hypothetical protein
MALWAKRGLAHPLFAILDWQNTANDRIDQRLVVSFGLVGVGLRKATQ